MSGVNNTKLKHVFKELHCLYCQRVHLILK